MKLRGMGLFLGVFSLLTIGSGCNWQISNAPVKIVNPGRLALTPAMGWNSWNVWGCNVDDWKIRDAADKLVSSGLAAHGFQYVNIDDCWQDSQRNPDGSIRPHPSRFPDMKALADYVHGKGLKIGIYSSPGPTTCQGYPGSLGHEQQDAETYAKWGMDYLKYDWCSYKGNDYQKPYREMGQILQYVGRDIYFSLCQYGMGKVWEWGASVGGNSWRTTDDIIDSWDSLIANGFSQAGLGNAKYAGPGHWNDPDMLVVGVLGGAFDGTQHPSRLTPSEQFTHITLWSMLSAPLLIGADLSRLDAFTLSLLGNDEVLAIDQDKLGKEAIKAIDAGDMQVYTRPLADGTLAAAIFNMKNSPQSDTLIFKDIGLSGSLNLRDLWSHQELGAFQGSYTVEIPPHGAVLLKISYTRQSIDGETG